MSFAVRSGCALALSALASCQGDKRALTLYAGRYTDASLPNDIALLRPVHFESSELAALAYAQRFHRFAGEGGQWEWEGQVAKHTGDQDHLELNALVVLRWQRFPWSENLRTSVALGEGLSWASEVPALEESLHTDGDAAQLLNYLLIEAAAGLPSMPDWDLVFRIHHRSGIFGVFDGVDGGSNVLAVGVKWRP